MHPPKGTNLPHRFVPSYQEAVGQKRRQETRRVHAGTPAGRFRFAFAVRFHFLPCRALLRLRPVPHGLCTCRRLSSRGYPTPSPNACGLFRLVPAVSSFTFFLSDAFPLFQPDAFPF